MLAFYILNVCLLVLCLFISLSRLFCSKLIIMGHFYCFLRYHYLTDIIKTLPLRGLVTIVYFYIDMFHSKNPVTLGKLSQSQK